MNDRSDRLRHARINAGFDQASDAATRFGWNVNTYKSNENGNAPFSFKKAKDYAKAFGVRPEWLYDASGEALEQTRAATPLMAASQPGDPISLAELRPFLAQPPEVAGRLRQIERRIPVVGEVAAGLWREAPIKDAQDVREWLTIDVRGYERALLRAFKVVGPSMNLVYPDGRYVVTAHPAEAGLRYGDHVIVERRKTDLVELTLKELINDNGRVGLMPRSSHEDFQSPIYLAERDEFDQSGVQIIGVVVADYSRRERPPLQFDKSDQL